MHFTRFIMHKYIHAYSWLCCMHHKDKQGGGGVTHPGEINPTEIHTHIKHEDIGVTCRSTRRVHEGVCVCNKSNKDGEKAAVRAKSKIILKFLLLSPLHVDGPKRFTGYKFTNTKHHCSSRNVKTPLECDSMLTEAPLSDLYMHNKPLKTAELNTDPWYYFLYLCVCVCVCACTVCVCCDLAASISYCLFQVIWQYTEIAYRVYSRNEWLLEEWAKKKNPASA